MWRYALSAALLLLCSIPAFGQIEFAGLKSEYELGEPIVFDVNSGVIPEGAKIRGSVTVSNGTAIGIDVDTFHVWAKPGKQTITASGVWVLTRDVTIGEETFPVLVDFGQYADTAEFSVLGGGEPPPPLPPPTGKMKIWFAAASADRDNLPSYANSLAFRQQLEQLGHDYQETLTSAIIASPPARLSNVAQAVRDSSIRLPAVVLEPIAGGSFRVLELPTTADALLEVLK